MEIDFSDREKAARDADFFNALLIYMFDRYLNTQRRHKVFVSNHHARDQGYRDRFERLFAHNHDIMVSRSVQIGDIPPYLTTETVRQKIRDEYLSDSTVTVVLIGMETWQRKHVDWEIASSIRHTGFNPRSGLLGILLPSYHKPSPDEYQPSTIPPRLYDNIKCKFASIHDWSENPLEVSKWIHDAFLRRDKVTPDNSFPTSAHNRTGLQWQR